MFSTLLVLCDYLNPNAYCHTISHPLLGVIEAELHILVV